MSTPDLFTSLHALREAALQAVDPAAAVSRCLHTLETPGGLLLRLENPRVETLAAGRIYLIAMGKAAVPMALAAVERLGDRLSGGVVVTKTGHVAGARLPAQLQVFEAGHPVPDETGLRAALAIEALAGGLQPSDVALVLISGGASALTTCPAAPLTLADLQQTNQALLRGGAAIGEINTVRKHLDRLKGGRLARLLQPARVLTLVLSDVVGDPLDVIASGPCMPDPTSHPDALDVLARYDLLAQAPAAVLTHLRAGAAGQLDDTPKPGDPLFAGVETRIVASNRLAALAAVQRAEQLGFHSLLLTTFMEGEAREVARVAAALAKGVRAHADPLPAPACLVWGGETTVTVRGKGRGGRNQELALAAALALEGLPDVALMALATDGSDGPTDSAGALVDGETVIRARAAGLDAHAYLADNDAYAFFDRAGGLLVTGPTGTNVNDLLVLLVG